MAKNCKNTGSIPRYALLLMLIAGGNAIAANAAAAENDVQQDQQSPLSLVGAFGFLFHGIFRIVYRIFHFIPPLKQSAREGKNPRPHDTILVYHITFYTLFI